MSADDSAERIYFMPAMAGDAPSALDQVKVGDYLQALGTRFKVTEIRRKPQPSTFVGFFGLDDDIECADCDAHTRMQVAGEPVIPSAAVWEKLGSIKDAE